VKSLAFRQVPLLSFSFRQKCSASIVLAGCLWAGTLSQAQTVNLGDDVARPIPGAGHDYVNGLSETVNPANGNLTIKIDLPVPKARGLTIPFAVTYNSGEVYPFVSMKAGCGGFINSAPCTAGSYPTFRTTNGWSDTFPYATASGTFVSLPPFAPLTSGQPGTSYCATSSSYNFYDPSGGSHMLGLAAISPVLGSMNYETAFACDSITYNTTNCFHTQESGFYGCTGGDPYQAFSSGGDDEVNAQSSLCNGNYSETVPTGCAYGAPPFTVTDKSGTVYSFSGGCGGNGLAGAACYEYPTQIEDRNGNILKVSGASLTDTLGRTLISILSGSNSNPPGPTTYTVGGLNYVADWTTTDADFTSGSNQIDIVPAGTIPTGAACGTNFTVNETSLPVIQYLTLPNGQEYTFKYDSTWGLVNEIDYPDGGWVKYTWKLSDTMSEVASFSASQNGGAYPPLSGYCNFQYQTPVVATRSVGYSAGSAAAETEQFAYYTSWGTPPQNWAPPSSWPPFGDKAWTTRTTYVITTDNVTNESSETVYKYGNVYQPLQPNSAGQMPAELPVESTVAHYDWGHTATPPATPTGTPLETETKTWLDQFEMGSEQIALNNGQSSKTVYTYNSYSNSTPAPGELTGFPEQVLEKDDYDFGSTPTLSRKTTYNYYWLGFPNQVIVENAAGAWMAETDATYDGQAVTGVSNLTTGTHDETNYGSTSTTQRGNPTKVIKCLSGTGASCAGPTTTYTFDETGQVLSRTDPCGNSSCSDMTGSSHTTTYSYADSFTSGGPPSGHTNAYLTQITYPTTAAGVTSQESFSYDYVTGFLTKSIDENLQPTTYVYNTPPSGCGYIDGLNRLSQINYPDGGETTYCYDDAARIITTSKLIGGSAWETSVATMDGVGHVIETQLTSDPDGSDTVNTVYDGMGNVRTKTNPYRSTLDSTYGIATYYYDALGRQIKEIEPDGISIVQSCYNGVASSPTVYCSSSHQGSVTTGSWVDSTDENGNHWQRTSDAFGRLTEVMEPNGASQSPTMETDYSYDQLNNLLTVGQWGGPNGSSGERVRSFTYDSLSRLGLAMNPETGNVQYTYDADDNVVTKTDARSFTASYKYDALNRVLSKTFSVPASGQGSMSNTPSSCYQYDSAAVNGIGRLSNAWTQSASLGACATTAPATGFWTKRSIVAYDQMGRVWNEFQSTPAASTTGTSSPPCKTGTQTGISYCYDLLGNLTFSSSGINSPLYLGGSNSITLTNAANGAGRLQTVTGNVTSIGANGVALPTLLFSPPGTQGTSCTSQTGQYSAFGGLMNAAFGNGLVLNRSYDHRLRTSCETDMGSTLGTKTYGSATVTITGSEQNP
jgi:YD repeat-containing protein